MAAMTCDVMQKVLLGFEFGLNLIWFYTSQPSVEHQHYE